jgi:hypothetical protein
MKLQRVLIALTAVNLVLLVFALTQARPAAADGVPPVLRGRALEIVDDHGKVRASITVFPPDPTHPLADGKPYPETVLLRLIDERGRPNVKISAQERGGIVGLGGESDPTYAWLGAQGTSTSLKLTNKDGKQQSVKP